MSGSRSPPVFLSSFRSKTNFDSGSTRVTSGRVFRCPRNHPTHDSGRRVCVHGAWVWSWENPIRLIRTVKIMVIILNRIRRQVIIATGELTDGRGGVLEILDGGASIHRTRIGRPDQAVRGCTTRKNLMGHVRLYICGKIIHFNHEFTTAEIAATYKLLQHKILAMI